MTGKRRVWAGAVAVLALLLSACGGGGDDRSDGARVALRLIAFKPANVTISAGETVTWTNEDAAAHTVTSGTIEQGGSDVTARPDGRFDGGALAEGKAFSHRFPTAGTFPYFCNIHPATMRGEVTVA